MTRQQVIDRLYALANGREPWLRAQGVCENASPGNDDTAHRAVLELYGCYYPISAMLGEQGEYCRPGKWEDARGELRRTLAAFVAAYLELG